MKYYIIEPEVSGGIGENTIYEENSNSSILHLHFIFDGWLGDHLLEITPCFMISEYLKNVIENNDLSGCEIQDMEVSFSDEFYEFEKLYDKREIPQFYRLIPSKIYNKGIDLNMSDMKDFMIDEKNYLIVSEKAKKIMELNGFINHADFELLF